MNENEVIITPDENDSTKGIITTKFEDKIEEVPNLIGNLRADVEQKDKEIEETQAALDSFIAANTVEIEKRKVEFDNRIVSLRADRDVIVGKIEKAINAGIEEVTPE